MHFQVPQFIETEDKIIGPLTIKQFFFVAGGGFTSFLLYFVTELWLWIILSAIIMGLSASFAFVKVNGRSLTFFVKSALTYFWQPKTYVYGVKDNTQRETKETKQKILKKPRVIPATPLSKPVERKPEGSQMKNIEERLATTKTAIPKRELALPPALSEAPGKVKEHYEYVRKIAGDQELARRVDYK